MFLKFTLICLLISMQKSLAAFAKFDQSIPEDKTKHPLVIPVRCGLECILQCSIGNHQLNFGCFDKCLYDSPSNCQWKKILNKDARAETQEMTENLEELHQLRNITFGELCSVPCNNETEVPEMICDLCKSVPDLPKNLTIGNICENDPCSMNVPTAAKFCDFCNFIDDIARGNGKFLDIFKCVNCVGEIVAAGKTCVEDKNLVECVNTFLKKINPEDHCFSCVENVLQVVGMVG